MNNNSKIIIAVLICCVIGLGIIILRLVALHGSAPVNAQVSLLPATNSTVNPSTSVPAAITPTQKSQSSYPASAYHGTLPLNLIPQPGDKKGWDMTSVGNIGDATAPFTFAALYPQNLIAGFPVTCTYTIFNEKSDVAIIKVGLDFDGTYNGLGIDTPNAIHIKPYSVGETNLFINKGAYITGSFTIQINQPGTYQFKVMPWVQAGDQQSIGTYVISLNVHEEGAE